MEQYVQSKNRGLPTNFTIVNGKFGLTGGVVKCQDNIRMLIIFGGWFRLMLPDFCVNLYWLLNKPTSWLLVFKTVILGRFILAAEKYAPFIKVQKSNIYYEGTGSERKEVTIGIEYTYSLDRTDTPQQLIQKIN